MAVVNTCVMGLKWLVVTSNFDLAIGNITFFFYHNHEISQSGLTEQINK